MLFGSCNSLPACCLEVNGATTHPPSRALAPVLMLSTPAATTWRMLYRCCNWALAMLPGNRWRTRLLTHPPCSRAFNACSDNVEDALEKLQEILDAAWKAVQPIEEDPEKRKVGALPLCCLHAFVD